MKLQVINLQGKPVGEVDFADELAVKGRGSQSLIESVTAYRANQRAGTASTKTKGTVNGSGKKPWKQKGTGMARAGYRQSPVWRGGGVVFGPHPRSFRKGLPKGVGKLALRRALTDRLVSGSVKVVDAFTIDQPKTKNVVAAIKGLGLKGSTLLILPAVSKEITLASRNLARFEVSTSALVNTYQILKPVNVVITRDGLHALAARLEGVAEKAS